MAEPDFDIDAAGKQYEAGREAGEKFEAPADEKEDDAPPADDGFKGYEDYIADGGDPDLYKGKKAFQEDRGRFKENRDMKRTIKDLHSTVQQTMEATNQMLTDQRGKIRTEVEAELKEARANEDMDGALDAQNRLNKLDETPPAATPQAEHPVIQEFRDANPLVDANSTDYNKEFNTDVEAFYNATYEQLSRGGRVALSDGQVKRALGKAMKDAKELHADLFESPRNARQTGGNRPQRRTTQQEKAVSADSYVIKNPRNPRQANAAPEVREAIRQAAIKQAKKTGSNAEDQKKAGDKAAANFEKSLMS